MINYISPTDEHTKQSIIEHLIEFDHQNEINSNNILRCVLRGLGKTFSVLIRTPIVIKTVVC